MWHNNVRLVPKRLTTFVRLAEVLQLSRQTISTRFKNLQELGLIVDYAEDDEYYELIDLDPAYAALIPNETIKLLVDALNDRCISTYVYFFIRYYANGCAPFVFTFGQLKTFLGLSVKTQSNDDVVVNLLYVLGRLGLIGYTKTKSDGKTLYRVDYVRQSAQVDEVLKKQQMLC